MSTRGLIDVHAHFTTPHYIEAAKAAGHVEPDGMPEAYWPRWTADEHLALMDEAGIAKAILSLSSPGVHFGDDQAARSLAREVNEFCAQAVRDRPDRFGQLASLPLPDVDGTLGEIAYCFNELSVDGVMMFSNHMGVRLADKRLTPVLEELDRRAAVVLLHPTTCPGHKELSSGRPWPMIEFLFETARTVIDYILSGAATRYPRIRLIVPHLSGVLPLLTERVQAFPSPLGDERDGRPTVTEILGQFYYDLAGMPTKQQIAALAVIARPDHLLYGSDYVWTSHQLALKLLSDLEATMPAIDRDWRALTTRNAQQLFITRPGA
ncbi:amidohydrolase family protein [Streptomyces sp. NRRL S-813]|uniref:amidohydrolase family protein n=1 Tax=Streptomyces sp. NRRL S-813 TaxID=1463919 RepID=UPI0004C09617|nr:amidohydrolase family protein [Streptomyces sp. NRRL S-813]